MLRAGTSIVGDIIDGKPNAVEVGLKENDRKKPRRQDNGLKNRNKKRQRQDSNVIPNKRRWGKQDIFSL